MGSGINLLLFSMVPPSRWMLHCRVTKKNLIYLHDLLKRVACFPILTSLRCLFAPRDRSDCRDRSSDQSNNTFSFSEEESVNGRRLRGLRIGLFCDSRRGAGLRNESGIHNRIAKIRKPTSSPVASRNTSDAAVREWAIQDSNKRNNSRRNLTMAHCATQNTTHAVQIPV